jgi:hypothetical protein
MVSGMHKHFIDGCGCCFGPKGVLPMVCGTCATIACLMIGAIHSLFHSENALKSVGIHILWCAPARLMNWKKMHSFLTISAHILLLVNKSLHWHQDLCVVRWCIHFLILKNTKNAELLCEQEEMHDIEWW